MTLDDIKGRTYTNQADFWRDVEEAEQQAYYCGYEAGRSKGEENASLGWELVMHSIADALGVPKDESFIPATPTEEQILEGIKRVVADAERREMGRCAELAGELGLYSTSYWFELFEIHK